MDQQSSKSDIQPEISFRPITEGLGFHPFSDGCGSQWCWGQGPIPTTRTAPPIDFPEPGQRAEMAQC